MIVWLNIERKINSIQSQQHMYKTRASKLITNTFQCLAREIMTLMKRAGKQVAGTSAEKKMPGAKSGKSREHLCLK